MWVLFLRPHHFYFNNRNFASDGDCLWRRSTFWASPREAPHRLASRALKIKRTNIDSQFRSARHLDPAMSKQMSATKLSFIPILILAKMPWYWAKADQPCTWEKLKWAKLQSEDLYWHAAAPQYLIALYTKKIALSVPHLKIIFTLLYLIYCYKLSFNYKLHNKIQAAWLTLTRLFSAKNHWRNWVAK